MWLGKGVRAYVADYHNIRHGLIFILCPGFKLLLPGFRLPDDQPVFVAALDRDTESAARERTLTALLLPGSSPRASMASSMRPKIPAASLLQTV
jgi:hypothetical protein